MLGMLMGENGKDNKFAVNGKDNVDLVARSPQYIHQHIRHYCTIISLQMLRARIQLGQSPAGDTEYPQDHESKTT